MTLIERIDQTIHNRVTTVTVGGTECGHWCSDEMLQLLRDCREAEADRERLRAVLPQMIAWAENPPVPQSKGHICGPEGNCDHDCMIFARMCQDVMTARSSLAASDKVQP